MLAENEAEQESHSAEEGENSPKEATVLISQARTAAERLEKANAEMAKLLDKRERMIVEQTLGGETIAGRQEKTIEDKDLEEAKRLLSGTGMEDYAFPEETKKP